MCCSRPQRLSPRMPKQHVYPVPAPSRLTVPRSARKSAERASTPRLRSPPCAASPSPINLITRGCIIAVVWTTLISFGTRQPYSLVYIYASTRPRSPINLSRTPTKQSMATAEHDTGTHFHAMVPRSAHLMVSCLAHPEGQLDRRGPSACEQSDAKSTPCSIAFSMRLISSIRQR